MSIERMDKAINSLSVRASLPASVRQTLTHSPANNSKAGACQKRFSCSCERGNLGKNIPMLSVE